MIDIKLLREQTQEITKRLGSRGVDPDMISKVLEIDSKLLGSMTARDAMRERINKISAEVAQAMRDGDAPKAEELRRTSRELGEQLGLIERQCQELEDERRSIWAIIPNIPDDRVPIGLSEEDNVVERAWSPSSGERKYSEFTLPEYPDHKRVPHWEIGEQLGLLDLGRAAKISGSMFPMFKGPGARLLRAMTSLALDEHEDSYLEVRPPTFVRRQTMVSTGHLPKFEDDAYHMEVDDLFAIPTAEVPLTSMFKDEILEEKDLPLRLCAVSPCFRREAGSAGKDTRGLLRLHEFDKVELFACCTYEQRDEAMNDILVRAEGLLQRLGLIYRVVQLCTGDLGISSARTIDLEVYAPGVDRWLEVSSVSWFSDYQARRANLRYRSQSDGRVRLLNTVNGSALAWPRIWAAIVEANREADGGVSVPEALHPYLGGRSRISPEGRLT